MNVYIYQADLWCEDCGEQIKQDLIDEGKAPEDHDDETLYDSDDFPKGAPDGGGEADMPHHCAAMRGCINALDLGDCKVGAWLENPLTSDGEDYVRSELADNRNTLTEFWGEVYNLGPYFRAWDVAQALAETARNGNRKDVISELEDMDPIQAAAVAFCLTDHLDGDSETSSALYILLSRAADEG